MFKRSQVIAFLMAALGVQQLSQEEGREVLTQEQKAEISKAFSPDAAEELEKILLSTDENASVDMTKLATMIADQKKQEIEKAVEAGSQESERKIQKLTAENLLLKAQNGKLASKPEDVPKPEMGNTRKKPTIDAFFENLKLNEEAPHNAMVLRMQETSQFPVLSQSSIEVSDIREEFGPFIRGNKIYPLYKQIQQGFETSKHLKKEMAGDEYREVGAFITSVSQPYSTGFNPTGKVQFEPRRIYNRQHKIDFMILPAAVLKSYMMYMYNESVSLQQMPLTKFIMEMIKEKLLSDIELRMIAKGRYDETAIKNHKESDAALPPEKAMDGFETQLVRAYKAWKGDKTKSRINFVKTTLKLADAQRGDFLKAVESFKKALPPHMRTIPNLPVFCSQDFYDGYMADYQDKWRTGGGVDTNNFGTKRIDHSNLVLTPLPSMYMSPILFTTTSDNFKMLISENTPPSVFTSIQEFNRYLKFLGEYHLAVGFAYDELVVAAVPDGYEPYDMIGKAYGESTGFSSWQGNDGDGL